MEKKYDKSGINFETYKQLFKINKILTEEEKIKLNENKEKEFYYNLSDFIDTSIIDNILIEKVGKTECECHFASLILSSMLDKENSILTGYRKNKDSDEKTIHSVVEIKDENGIAYILDYTDNIIMRKDQYIELNLFEEIQSISNKDCNEDIKKVMKHLRNFGMKFYLSFRDEIMRNFEKNKKIFEEDEQGDDR